MWPFKYIPFQVLSCGAIYCAVNGIFKIDCSNENSTSVFVTLLVFPFLKKNNLPWSNQVFHEIFQLTVWVPLQWLEEDSKERQHVDQPLKQKQRLSWKDSDFEKVRREIVCRGNVLLISYRNKSLYLRSYICATQIERQTCPLDALHTSSTCLTSWYKKNRLFFQTTLEYRHLVGLAHHLFSCVYS